MIPAINRPGQPFRFRNLGAVPALSRRIRLGPAVGRRTGRDTGVGPPPPPRGPAPDAQLDEAIRLALEALESSPAKVPPAVP
jgi:hypothetical protein